MIFYDVVQGSQDWHDKRRGVPTASNFDKILTPAKLQPSAQAEGYMLELAAEIYSLTPPDGSENYMSRPMLQGIEVEPEARRWYAQHVGVDVANGGFCTTDDGRFGCSPDGLVGTDGLLELKCPMLKTHIDYLRKGTVPTTYVLQVHGQLLVTGRQWCDFVSYACHASRLPPLVVRVERDATTQKLADALEVFWAQYVELLAVLKLRCGEAA